MQGLCQQADAKSKKDLGDIGHCALTVIRTVPLLTQRQDVHSVRQDLEETEVGSDVGELKETENSSCLTSVLPSSQASVVW